MRVTLDTNQFLRALMRPSELATILMAWQAQRFTVVCSTQLLEEYQITLAYPQIAKLIFPELRRIFLTQLIDEMEIVELPQIARISRDQDDDKVIATAVYDRVDYLATTDDDLRVEPVVGILQAQGIRLTTIDEMLSFLD